MEKRKPIPEIQMERSAHSLFVSELLSEFTEGGNRGAEFLFDLCVFIACALFSTTHAVFGVFPLGFAYLAVSRHRLLPALLGCIAGALTLGNAGIVYTLIYILLFFARSYISAPIEKRSFFPICERYFSESVALRFSLLIVASLFVSVYELFVGGINSTSLLFSLGMVTLPLLAGILFLGVAESDIRYTDIFGVGESSRTVFGKRSPLYLQLSLLFICACLCYTLSRISLFGLSFDFVFCSLSTLFVSRRFGALRASIVGGICAMLLDIVYAPSFVALGLVSGILWQFGSFYALSVGTALAVGWAGYIGGVEGFVTVAPEICVTSLLSLPFFSRVRSEPDNERIRAKKKALFEDTVASAEKKQKSERTSRLSNAFSGASDIFSADTKIPSGEDYFSLCEKVCEGSCSSCAKRGECWESEEKPAYKAMRRISESLSETGKIKNNEYTNILLSKCKKFKESLEKISHHANEIEKERIYEDAWEFISYDYAMTAKLLSQSASFEKRETTRDTATEAALTKALCEITDEELCCIVFGHRKKTVVLGAHRGDILKKHANEIHGIFEKVCGCRFSSPEFCRTFSGFTMRSETIHSLEVEYATAKAPTKSGEVSGDNAKCFQTKESFFYSVISDGMGTGEKASKRSFTTVSFIEKMLSSGAGKSITLRMINNLLRFKKPECSATVDLFELDTVYRKGTFLKCGAAPSYIKRGEDIFVIKSRTSPIGLLRDTDAQKSDFEIKSGDIIVLLSDGVVSAEDGDWLLSVLGGDMDGDLFAAASELVALAGKRTDQKDDATVTLIRVK